MLRVDDGAYFGLKGSSKVIWEALSTPRSLNEICDLVVEKYPDVVREVALEDARSFVQDLLANDLVKVREDEEAA